MSEEPILYPVPTATTYDAAYALLTALGKGHFPHAEACKAWLGAHFHRGGYRLAVGSGDRCTCGLSSLQRIAAKADLNAMARDIRVLFEFYAAVNDHQALLKTDDAFNEFDEPSKAVLDSSKRVEFWQHAAGYT